MKCSRRFFIAGGTALAASPGFAGFPQVLPDGLLFFVGNSFTRQHGIAARVCALAEATGRTAHCHPNTANGATLTDQVSAAENYASERGGPLPATVILQDHSIEPLTVEGRVRSARAMEIYAAQFQRTVLFATWPRQVGHAFYSKPGNPKSPEEMADMVHLHYVAQAAHLGATVAPVGRAWQQAGALGHDLYARDGYHANETGAHLTALVLAHALGIQLPENDPMVQFVPT